METVIIDLRPKVKNFESFGREKHADVHFRIHLKAYEEYLTGPEDPATAREAVQAFEEEVVQLLAADGWTLCNKDEWKDFGHCPQMVKGAQYLYCHPQDINGNVLAADVERLAALFGGMKTCSFWRTDNYGDVIITTSEKDEKQLYHDSYPQGIGGIWQQAITAKRKDLFFKKETAVNLVVRRIAIKNRRSDLKEIGCGFYEQRLPVRKFVIEEYESLLSQGLIKECKNMAGVYYCRYANKKEQKQLKQQQREEQERFAKQERLENALCFTEEQHRAFNTLADAVSRCRQLGIDFAVSGSCVYAFRADLLEDLTLDMAPRKGQESIENGLCCIVEGAWDANDGLYANVKDLPHLK